MPDRFRDRLGQLVGTFDLEELTTMLLRAGVAPALARSEAARRLGLPASLGAAGTSGPNDASAGRLSENVTGDSVLRSPRSGAEEKIHTHRMDQLVVALGGRVYRLSQSRATKQSLGLMDRIYVFVKLGKWYTWEAKAEWGELREEQRVFAVEAEVVGIPHVVGGYGAMRAKL